MAPTCSNAWIVRWRESHCNSKRTPSILHGLLMERLFILSTKLPLDVTASNYQHQDSTDWGWLGYNLVSWVFKLSIDIPNQRPTQKVPAFAPQNSGPQHLGISFHPAFQFRCRVGIHCERDIMMLAKSVQTRAVFFFRIGEPSQGIFTYISLRISQMWVNISWPWILWDRNYNLVCFRIASPHLVDS